MEPFKPTGIGAVAAMNVFKWVFSQPTSAPPKLKAWDDYLMATVLYRIFIGTAINGNKPMIGAIGCDEAPAADWFPTEMIMGAEVNVASLLKGNVGFCQLSEEALEALEEVFANIDFLFPSDAEPADTFGGVLAIEYEYTGDPPEVTAYGNKGTEETPDWQALVIGIKGSAPQPGDARLRCCNSGEGYDGTGTLFLTRPESGQAHPGEIWVEEYAA
jgi:hypothetical protein